MYPRWTNHKVGTHAAVVLADITEVPRGGGGAPQVVAIDGSLVPVAGGAKDATLAILALDLDLRVDRLPANG